MLFRSTILLFAFILTGSLLLKNGAASRMILNGAVLCTLSMSSNVSSDIVWSILSNVNPALLTIWFTPPYAATVASMSFLGKSWAVLYSVLQHLPARERERTHTSPPTAIASPPAFLISSTTAWAFSTRAGQLPSFPTAREKTY